jgi:hypothetical protein
MRHLAFAVGAMLAIGASTISHSAIEAAPVPARSPLCVAIPSGAAGDVAVINITNTDATGPGYGALRASDADRIPSRPAADQYSSVNFAPGEPDPNLAFVQIGPDGRSCYDSDGASANVILDLVATIPASKINNIEPERLADTRTQGRRVAPRRALCLSIPGATPGDVAVVNITNTDATGSGYGALRASDTRAVPSRSAAEQFSSVNFAPGATNPNLAFVTVGPDGRFCYDSDGGSAHVILDLVAIIPAANANASEPQRLTDTRTEGRRVLPRQELCLSVPVTPGDVAVVNITNTHASESGYGALRSSYAPPVPSRPAAEQFSSVNFAPGATNPNLAFVTVGADGRLCYDSNGGSAHVILDLVATIAASNIDSIEPDRVADTRDATHSTGPLVLIDPPRESTTSIDCAPSTLAANQRIDVDPRLGDLMAGIDWTKVDALMFRRLAATVMTHSGPFPSAVGRSAGFDGWVQRLMPSSDEGFSAYDLSRTLAASFHETVHGFQRGRCALAAAGMGYPTPRVGPAQSEIHADVRNRITTLIPDPNNFCRTTALPVADLYLTGFVAEQGLASQLWEINAYVLDLEFSERLWTATGLDLGNTGVQLAKLHQLSRYLQHAKGFPGLWDEMKALGVDKTVADHWNLAVSLWQRYDFSPDCWNLAFGPDSAVIAEFTGGLAGTTAPPRSSTRSLLGGDTAGSSSSGRFDLSNGQLELDLFSGT